MILSSKFLKNSVWVFLFISSLHTINQISVTCYIYIKFCTTVLFLCVKSKKSNLYLIFFNFSLHSVQATLFSTFLIVALQLLPLRYHDET